MEMILKNGFCEMEQNEMLEVEGGVFPLVPVVFLLSYAIYEGVDMLLN